MQAALGWIDANIVRDPKSPLQGFLMDFDYSPKALNNVWKDSNEPLKLIPGPSDRFVRPQYPVACSEVQAYIYGA